MRNILSGAFFIVVIALISGAAEAKCFVPLQAFVPDGVTRLDVAVNHDEPCEMRLGYIATVTDFHVTMRPRHGVIGRAERTTRALYIAYKPNNSFVGTDQIVAFVRFQYLNIPLTQTTQVIYNITVR